MRQRRGAFGEDVAVAWLEQSGWLIVARNLKIGVRDEIDIVAVDPGPPQALVCAEVRSSRSPDFGAPEERVDARKVGNLYRAARAFARSSTASQLGVGGMNSRVDLIVVDLRSVTPQIRHLKRLEPA
jgi:putative endonuclease